MILLRNSTENDLADVTGLWDECGLVVPWNNPEADFILALSSPSSAILVLEDNQQIVATVMVGLDGHRGWFYFLAVKPEFQKTGLGRQIIEAGEDWLKERGCPKAMLMVRHTNNQVIDFYKQLGYKMDEVSVFGKRLDGN